MMHTMAGEANGSSLLGPELLDGRREGFVGGQGDWPCRTLLLAGARGQGRVAVFAARSQVNTGLIALTFRVFKAVVPRMAEYV